MAWQRPRARDVMFAVSYRDGRTAYITVDPKFVEHGDHLTTELARERQKKGEIPEGEIKAVKRVR